MFKNEHLINAREQLSTFPMKTSHGSFSSVVRSPKCSRKTKLQFLHCAPSAACSNTSLRQLFFVCLFFTCIPALLHACSHVESHWQNQFHACRGTHLNQLAWIVYATGLSVYRGVCSGRIMGGVKRPATSIWQSVCSESASQRSPRPSNALCLGSIGP